uniref:hypothetical protein n=1 Tax=Bacteroides uniformis TaxID=820 RepID=UPI003FEDB556
MKFQKENKRKQHRTLYNEKSHKVSQLVTKGWWNDGDLFTIEKSDLNTGTGTTEKTRSYVNNNWHYVPTKVKFDYAISTSSKEDAINAVKRNPNCFICDNAKADYSYGTGRYWDAGHKLARQNGGKGDVESWVFPQNPSMNQGNSRLMYNQQYTFPFWRAHENDFHDKMNNLHPSYGCWWVKLE